MMISNWDVPSLLEWLIVTMIIFTLMYAFIASCFPHLVSTLKCIFFTLAVTGFISLVISYEIVK